MRHHPTIRCLPNAESRCQVFITSTKLFVNALTPDGVCTVPVPRPWRSLRHVSVVLPFSLAQAPPRQKRQGQGSSGDRRSSPAAALIQRKWRNLALSPPSNGRNRVLKSNLSFSKSPRRIMSLFWRLLFVLFPRQPGSGVDEWVVRRAKRPTERRKGGLALAPTGRNTGINKMREKRLRRRRLDVQFC
jgi:hypothetical protein